MPKKVILFGEYLLRLTPPAQQKLLQAQVLEMHWAGSEANVGVSLSLLGDAAMYVTCLPQNTLAQTGLAQLYKYNITTHVHWKEGRVGLFFYESGIGVRSGKVLYDREPSSFSLLQKGELNWNVILDEGDWFHWSGITPALTESLIDVCEEALLAAKEKRLFISADFNYRSTLWNHAVPCRDAMPKLLQYCDLVLADVDAAKLYLDVAPDADHLVESTCALIKEMLPNVQYIAMTMRNQSSEAGQTYNGYLWQNGSLVTSKPYPVNIVAERMGTGDAFMAGLIYMLRNKKEPSEAIEFATACGALKHTITGDFNLAGKEEIEGLMTQSGYAKIIR